MASTYVPTTFYRGGEIVVAESWQEHHQLLWDGWSANGPAPEPPRTGQVVTFGDLSAQIDPILARLLALEDLVDTGRLSEAALAEQIGSGGGGGTTVSPFSIDTDGYPYLNANASQPGSPISIDTDGYPYLNANAGQSGSGVGIDTDGYPYLIGA